MKIQIELELTKEQLIALEIDCGLNDDTSINGVPLGEIYAQIERQLIYERAVKDIGYVL